VSLLHIRVYNTYIHMREQTYAHTDSHTHTRTHTHLQFRLVFYGWDFSVNHEFTTHAQICVSVLNIINARVYDAYIRIMYYLA